MQQQVWNATSIRKERKDRGWTQDDLADALGCRQQTISEWELAQYEPKNAYQKLISLTFQQHVNPKTKGQGEFDFANQKAGNV